VSGNEEIRIAPLTIAHLDQVLAIERASFSDPWTRGMFVSELSVPETGFARAAMRGDRMVGYLFAILIPEEAHLGNLAVDPNERRRGVAQLLLAVLLTEARRQGVTRLTLEVRESNQAARKFYCHNGFIDIAIRKNYYRSPVEDAIVMYRGLPEDPSG